MPLCWAAASLRLGYVLLTCRCCRGTPGSNRCVLERWCANTNECTEQRHQHLNHRAGGKEGELKWRTFSWFLVSHGRNGIGGRSSAGTPPLYKAVHAAADVISRRTLGGGPEHRLRRAIHLSGARPSGRITFARSGRQGRCCRNRRLVVQPLHCGQHRSYLRVQSELHCLR